MSAVNLFRRLFDRRSRTIRHPKPAPHRTRLAIQELELRSLLAASLTATLDLAVGVLYVEGTDAADQIHVRHSGGAVRIDGITIAVTEGGTTTAAASVPRGRITKIVVAALDGDDVVQMHDTLKAREAAIPMAIHGGAGGGDTLTGGQGGDSISGGPGVDSILGGAGKDALYGAGIQAAAPAALSFYPGEGTAADTSGGNPGTLNGDVTFGPGKVGQAFEFDGTLDYVDLGSDPSLDLPGSMSVSLWVRLDSLDTEKYFLADFPDGGTSQGALGTTGPAYWYQSYTDGSSDSITGVTPLQLNQWYHLSAVRDDVAKTVRLFVNGVEEGTVNFAGKEVVPLTASKFLGGSSLGYPGDFIDGQLDEVGIYNRALNPAEVQTLFLTGSAGGPDDGAGDVLNGQAGDDYLNGGAGNDSLIGLDGSDGLDGEAGDDTLAGGTGDDFLAGGDGKDRLYAGDGNDYLYGGIDNDFMAGENGNDFLAGEAGADTMTGAFEFSQAETLAFADSLYGGEGEDSLSGGYGDDYLAGDAGADTLNGGYADDTLAGGDGWDWLIGENGNDILSGDDGADELHGNAGDDTLRGGLNFDQLFGEAGADQVWGGDGNDTLVGGNGHDRMFGEDGNDTMKGADEFNPIETDGDNYDYILGGRGLDRIWGGDGADTLVGGDGRDALYGEGGKDILKGADEFSPTETVGDNADLMLGGVGNDSMWGADGMDTLVGGDGRDALYGEGGNDTMKGADDLNANEPSGNNTDSMLGGPGDDAMWGGNGDDTLVGGDGFDGLYGENGADILKGAQEFNAQEAGGSADLLDGGNGNDTLWGGDGDDALYGGPEGDTLSGEGGNDGLFGGSGTNRLYGGLGADRFLTWIGGTDTVMDAAAIDAHLRFNDTTDITTRDSNEVDGAGNTITAPLRYTRAVWTDAEIRAVDGGLAFDHGLTGNTRMLKPAPSGDQVYATQVFSREGAYIPWTAAEMLNNVPRQVANVRGPLYAGWNESTGIVINTYGVSLGAESMQETTVHELAHNWDTESAVWTAWQFASGWTNTQPAPAQMASYTVSGDGRWWFLNTASNSFYRTYSQFNAMEDWTTTWEAYRLNRLDRLSPANAAKLAGKFAIINQFVTQISG